MRTLFLSIVVVCGNLLCYSSLRAQTAEDVPAFTCPLMQAVRHTDSAALRYEGSEERKLIISSPTDSLVKACADAVISTVQREADGTYGIVYSYEDFWFWVSGVQQPMVRAQQRVKQGQPIGRLLPGAKLEILLFDFETPVDPAEYLRCRQ